jgi:recombination protein RecA
MYGNGISKEGSLLDLGVEQDIIEKSGAWYTYEQERLGQGREAAKDFLKRNPDLANEIDQKVRMAVGLIDDGEDEDSYEIVEDVLPVTTTEQA